MGSGTSGLHDPAAADNDVAIVENDSLAGRDGALWLLKSNQYAVVIHADFSIGRLMAMTDLRFHPQGTLKLIDADPVQSLCAQCVGVQLVATTHHHLSLISAQFDYVKRRPRGHAQSFALTDGKVVDSGMGSQNLAAAAD